MSSRSFIEGKTCCAPSRRQTEGNYSHWAAAYMGAALPTAAVVAYKYIYDRCSSSWCIQNRTAMASNGSEREEKTHLHRVCAHMYYTYVCVDEKRGGGRETFALFDSYLPAVCRLYSLKPAKILQKLPVQWYRGRLKAGKSNWAKFHTLYMATRYCFVKFLLDPFGQCRKH